MPELDPNTHERKLQARVATLEELLRALEQTVVEQSDRLERSGAAQSHLAAIVQSSDAAIVSLSLDFRIETWNQGAERLFGYAREEAIGRNCADVLFPPTEKNRALAEFFTDVETFRHPVRNARYFEETFVRKDGTLFEAALIASGIYDDAGQLTGVSGIVRDISEQRRKDRDLTRLASIVESSEDAIISLGTDFRVTSWNRGAERLLGFAAREAIGATIVDLYVMPELRDDALSLLRYDLATLEAHNAIVHQLEVPVRRKDGTQVEVSIAVSGIYDGCGELVGMSNILHNITERKHAERDSARLAAIVESSGDAIVSLSQDGIIASWNRSAEKLFGFSAAEVVGQPTTIFVPAEQRQRAAQLISEIETNPGRTFSFEAPNLRKDGSRIETSMTIFGTYDRSGKLLGISSIHRDITEHRRAEREQALLAALVNSSEDAINSVSTDFTITSWNRGAEKLLGFTAAEAIGKKIIDLYVSPGEREYANKAMQEDLAEINRSPEFVRHIEGSARRKDGAILDVSITASGIYDSAGKLLGISNILRDITDRKRAERELAIMASIVNASDDAIIGFSRELKITSWNPAAEATYGFTAQEAIGSGFDLFVPVEDLPRAIEADQRLFETGQPVSFEQRAQKKDGTWFVSWVSIFPIRDAAGNIVAGAGIGRDISERKRAERELATLASIVNASEDAIISVSKDFKITSWNAAAEKAYGFTAAQALGQGLDLFVPPAELAQTVAAGRHVIETGQPASWEQHVERKDGTRFVSAVNIFATRDGAGRIMEIAGIGRDITRLKEIEKELREAHEYTRGLIDSSIDAMVMVDGESRIMDGNEQLSKLTESPKKVLIGSLFDSIFADPTAAQRALKQTFAEGYVTDVDLAIRAASGKEVAVSFNASLFYRAGKAFGIFGVARDVTQQRAIERTLREEREYSRSLVQSSPDGLLVCDSGLLLTDANEQAVALTGYPREELIGIKLTSLFSEPALANELLEKTAQQGRVNEVELQLLTKSARAVPVSVNMSALREGDGPARRIVAAARDISERKRAEKERSLLASIVNSSGDAIYSEATELTITSWNPAAEKLFGYGEAEIIGRSAALLAPLERRAEIAQHAQSVRLSGKPHSFETQRLRKDGSVIDVGITQSPILDSAGAVTALSVTAHDISQRKRMEVELAQARDEALEAARLKSEFLANMSHEIRTPLNSIIGMTGLLLDTELNAEQREFAHDVSESGDALLSLINNILDYSKIAAGKLTFEDIDFDLNGALESAVELVVNQARSKGVEVTASVDPEVPRLLRGDPGRLRQILVNLLGNAIKFTAHGEVGVAVSKLGENPKEATLRFEVRDTGIGIPKEKLHLLFEAFTQVDASTTRHYGGTGLGLSIARELVQGMHGTIAVSSTPGVGSMFWFTLKLAKQVDTSRPASERFASLTGTKIIIVDDNANSRRILERQVSAWGMLPRTVTSAEEALAMMRGEPFGVALLDVMMPDVDGVELARRIKTDPALAKTAVIFVSSVGSRSDFSTRLLGLDIGGWLMKPVPESSLYDALLKVLASAPDIGAQTATSPKEDRGPAPAPSASKFKLPDGRELKVLLAEDNPINQKVATLQLRKLGIDVEVVANGREAVEAVSRRPYDVIFMDCQMPEMDGYDATREIRRREGAGRQHTTIVAMTAHALPGDREKCLAAGMDSYISKPVTQPALEATLAELFAPKPSAETTSEANAAALANPPPAVQNQPATKHDENTVNAPNGVPIDPASSGRNDHTAETLPKDKRGQQH